MNDKFEIEENDVKTETNTGNVKISNEVVAAIAGISAEEIKGVAYMYASLPGMIAEKITNKKNQTKGVKVVIGDKGITIDLYVVVEYGVRIKDVAENVQESVKNNVETMTGMNIIAVNVHVEGVDFKMAPEDDDVKVIDAE